MHPSVLEGGSDSERPFLTQGLAVGLNSGGLSCVKHNMKGWQCLEVLEKEIPNVSALLVFELRFSCYVQNTELRHLPATLWLPVTLETGRRPSWRSSDLVFHAASHSCAHQS